MVRMMLALLFALLLTRSPGADAQVENLYFLNHPETTRTAGGLGEFEMVAGERGRVFFHFKNATGKGRTFTLTSDKPLDMVRMSSTVSKDAAYSGSTAAHKFFTGRVRSKRPFSISVYVPVGQVVSGIAEGTAAETTRVKCQMGAGELVLGAKVSVTPHIRKIYETDENGSVKVSIGDLGVADNIGNYGVTHSVFIKNAGQASRKYDIILHPRGGAAIVVYGINGEYTTTSRLPQYSQKRVATITVAAGKTSEFTTMPLGGVAYPLVIEVRPAGTSSSPGKVSAKSR